LYENGVPCVKEFRGPFIANCDQILRFNKGHFL